MGRRGENEMFYCHEFEECEYNAQPKCCLPDGMVCPHGVTDHKPTNSDRIRAMSDEDLATMLNRFAEGEDAPHYCRNLPECDADMEADNLIPLERCQACLLRWLQQPAEGDMSDAR